MKKVSKNTNKNTPAKSKLSVKNDKKIIEATKLTLHRYAKTFKDLAKYDRTEKIRV